MALDSAKFIDTRFNGWKENKKIVRTQVGSHCGYYWLVCYRIWRTQQSEKFSDFEWHLRTLSWQQSL